MSERKIPYKIYLEESEMPKTWYNVRADMKNKPAPLLNPETLQPMTEEELSVVFCKELVEQELDNDRSCQYRYFCSALFHRIFYCRDYWIYTGHDGILFGGACRPRRNPLHPVFY